MSESVGCICGSEVVMTKAAVMPCPNCGSDQEFWCEYHMWYGWYKTCLGCGERWGDGERLERPFMPKWRQKSIEEAKKRMTLLGHSKE
jgi:hypothetical protein